jgi:hypothetical protein
MWFGYKGILFVLQVFIKDVEEKGRTGPDVYYLVSVPPSPCGQWNHGLGGIFLVWSLNRKELYQSIGE